MTLNESSIAWSVCKFVQHFCKGLWQNVASAFLFFSQVVLFLDTYCKEACGGLSRCGPLPACSCCSETPPERKLLGQDLGVAQDSCRGQRWGQGSMRSRSISELEECVSGMHIE